jgi:hypothetical protein
VETKITEAEVVNLPLNNNTSLVGGNGLPTMEVTLPPQTPEKELFSDDEVVDVYKDIMGMIKEDRKEISEAISNFAEMVYNEGDPSSSSKEALVNLMKMKTEAATNMTKVLELAMRAKLKERDTYKPYLNATQHNEIKITGNSARNKLIEKLAKREKPEKEKE